MIPVLTREFQQLEQSYSLFIDDLRQFNDNEFVTAPEPGAWSAALVSEHLVIVEEIIVRGIQDKPQRRQVVRTLKDRFFGLAVKLYLGLGLRVKAPTDAILPVGNLSREQLEPRWRSARESLREFLETLSETTTKNLVMRHPISGPLDATATVAFLSLHINHHRKQLRRIRAALRAG